MWFSNGCTRVGFQTVLSVTQCSYKDNLDSFLSYQLVEADLLACIPALGDLMKLIKPYLLMQYANIIQKLEKCYKNNNSEKK